MFSCAFYVTKGESCFRILFLETVKTISILISLTLALALVLSQVNIQKEGKEDPSAVRVDSAPVRPEASVFSGLTRLGLLHVTVPHCFPGGIAKK